MIVSRPAADEFAPAYAGYVSRVADDEEILPVLRAQLDEVAARLARIPETQGGHRYAAGKWSVNEVVGHLSDSERIFACRALRFARGDPAPLPGFDENAYVPAMGAASRTLGELAPSGATCVARPSRCSGICRRGRGRGAARRAEAR